MQAKILMPFSHIIHENAFLSQIKDSCGVISFSGFFWFLLPSQRGGGCIADPGISFSILLSRVKMQEEECGFTASPRTACRAVVSAFTQGCT